MARKLGSKQLTKYASTNLANTVYKLAGHCIVFVFLAREPNDQISCQRNIWRDEPDSIDEFRVGVRAIGAVHRFENPIRSGLQW